VQATASGRCIQRCHGGTAVLSGRDFEVSARYRLRAHSGDAHVRLPEHRGGRKTVNKRRLRPGPPIRCRAAARVWERSKWALLSSAIAYVNSGKLRVRTEAEQQIWNECSRLIANAVIYYNAAISSRVLERKQAAGDNETVEILKGISPVAWQHVNLFGRFEFSKRGKVDLAALAKVFDEPECWNRITQAKIEED
jgi:hypothetical protein